MVNTITTFKIRCISINIISYSQVIIKARQIPFSRGLFVLLVFLASCGGNGNGPSDRLVVSIDALKLDPSNGTWSKDGELFTGIANSLFPNENLATEVHFFDGTKHGIVKKWFKNGTLSYEVNYVNGKIHGMEKSWWVNGNLRSEGHYQNGVIEGIQKQWYLEGMKFKVRTIKDGREAGLQQAWRKNGKLYVNYEAKNGRTFGLKKAGMCYEVKNEKVQLDEKE
ncbi:MAG: hypothetical protein COA38_06065 [Fluviicola sp.]|nr:MAG: hypothetical protein COA38_06065 [Fluviicola sp.]